MTLIHTILPDLTELGSRRKTGMHRQTGIKTLSMNTQNMEMQTQCEAVANADVKREHI